MIKLRTAIQKILKQYHSSVHFQKSPGTAVYPYVIYDFPTSFMDGDQEVFNLDVDVWDNSQDTSRIETLAEKLWKELNYLRYMDQDIQFSIYRENRLPPLDEEDSYLNRRKLIFQLRFIDRHLLN